MKNNVFKLKKARHIDAFVGSISPFVLICGSSERVAYAAKTFLKDVKLVAKNRGALVYTGTFKGVYVSISTSGMGQPSMAIFAYELFNVYGVDTIIRVGTAGALARSAKVYDLYNVIDSYNDLALSFPRNKKEKISSSSKETFDLISQTAEKLSIPLKTGRTHTQDIFYSDLDSAKKILNDHKCQLVSMESKILFDIAEYFNRNAATILFVSDAVLFCSKRKEDNEIIETTFEERINSLNNSFLIALETLVEISKLRIKV